jgi:sigma-E factor negative regulatory protein RseA
MTEQEFERLSALVDDELSKGEIASEIKKLYVSDGSRECWSRYHLIGDAMRREVGPLYSAGLAQQISRRLQDEPFVLAPAALRRRISGRKKTWASLAVAASLAGVAVVLAPQLISPEGADVPGQTVAQKQAPDNSTLYVAQDGTRWELLRKPEVESRLNTYLVNHQERSPTSNIKGIMPYTTFVSYDGNKK